MTTRTNPREGKTWPGYVFGGRMRTSTLVLVIAFLGIGWLYETYEPPPAPPEQVPASEVVPPGFIPDPNYTWAPRTDVQRHSPATTTTTTTTTTPTSTTAPTSTTPTTPTTPTPTTPTSGPPEPGQPIPSPAPSPTPPPPAEPSASPAGSTPPVPTPTPVAEGTPAPAPAR